MNIKERAEHSYGVIVGDDVFNTIVIEKGTIVPTSVTVTYNTKDLDKYLKIILTQGEGNDPDFVDNLDEIKIELPENKDIRDDIIITYSYDVNSMMHYCVNDLNIIHDTNKEHKSLDNFIIK